MVGVPPAGEPVWVLFDSNFSDCLAELGSNSSSFEHFRDHGRGVRVPSPIKFNAIDRTNVVGSIPTQTTPLERFVIKSARFAAALSTR